MRLSAAVAAGAVALLLLPAGAGAHASLVGGAPEPGGVASTAPRTLTIRFDEAVRPGLATLRVEDARGHRWEAGPVASAPGHGLRVALRRGLPDGQYVVMYKVVSDDGHTIPGGFGFAVGAGAAPPPVRIVAVPGGRDLGLAEAVARGVRDGAIAIVAGALAFLLLIWPAALADAAGAQERWQRASVAFTRALRRLVGAAAGIGALAAAAGILLAAATDRLTTTTIGAILGTRFGQASGLGALLLAGVAATTAATARRTPNAAAGGVLRVAQLGATGLAPARSATRPTLLLAGGLALLLAAVPVLAGHATTRPDAGILVASGLVHVLAASAWIGGIAVLLLALPRATRTLEGHERTALLQAALRRFSTVAVVAVAAVAVTGVVQAIVEVGDVDALTGAAFGRAVLVKAGLLVAVAGVAAAHRLDHLPALARRDGAPGPAGIAVRRTLRLEALGLIALVAAAGALAGYPPPSSTTPGTQSMTTTFEQATLRGRATRDAVSFALAKKGSDVAFSDLERVTVTARGPDGRTLRAAAPARRDGRYRIPLPLTHGRWRLAISLRIDAFNAATRTVDTTIN